MYYIWDFKKLSHLVCTEEPRGKYYNLHLLNADMDGLEQLNKLWMITQLENQYLTRFILSYIWGSYHYTLLFSASVSCQLHDLGYTAHTDSKFLSLIMKL